MCANNETSESRGKPGGGDLADEAKRSSNDGDGAESPEQLKRITESIKQLLQAEELSSKDIAQVDLQRVVVNGLVIIDHARIYCPQDEARLRAIEGRLARLERQSAPASGLRTTIGALIRIGVATVSGAAIGAPIGAWLVQEEVAKEVIKAAIATSISQACMEILQVGLSRRLPEERALRSGPDSRYRSWSDANTQVQEWDWGWGRGTSKFVIFV